MGSSCAGSHEGREVASTEGSCAPTLCLLKPSRYGLVKTGDAQGATFERNGRLQSVTCACQPGVLDVMKGG